MEEITDGVNNINITESKTKNRIQVSNTKKPLFFYVNLAKRYMQQYNEVELSALGMGILFLSIIFMAIYIYMYVCMYVYIRCFSDFIIGSFGNLFMSRIDFSTTINLQQYNEVELSALGMAIATVVTVAEILKNNGFAVEMKIMTSTVDMKDESRGRSVQKAKIEILLGKTAKFDELMAAQAEERERERERDRESGDVEVQS
ncbi:unnamed protein product [Camellia sinensis]